MKEIEKIEENSLKNGYQNGNIMPKPKVIQAVLCYLKRDGKTLMLHRNKKPNDIHAGKWNGLGGKIEQGEMPEDTVQREVFEESGLKLDKTKLSFHGMISFPNFSLHTDWYVYLYTARDFTGAVIESDEGELAWIEDDKVLQLHIWEGDMLFFSWIEKRHFFSAKMIYSMGKLLSHEVYFY